MSDSMVVFISYVSVKGVLLFHMFVSRSYVGLKGVLYFICWSQRCCAISPVGLKGAFLF